MQIKNTSGPWGAVIEGHHFDLLDWRDALQANFDPWVELHQIGGQERNVLRSIEFSAAKDVSEVRERALLLISKLNGAFLARQNGQPVRFGGVAEFRSDGSVGLSVFATMTGAMARVRVSAVGSGGIALPPTPSYAQKWIALAARDDRVAEILILQSKGANWYELYKIFEGVCVLSGGQSALKKKSWAPASTEISRFTHTANGYRHGARHPSRATPPGKPMPLEEASQLIARMVSSILEELSV